MNVAGQVYHVHRHQYLKLDSSIWDQQFGNGNKQESFGVKWDFVVDLCAWTTCLDSIIQIWDGLSDLCFMQCFSVFLKCIVHDHWYKRHYYDYQKTHKSLNFWLVHVIHIIPFNLFACGDAVSSVSNRISSNKSVPHHFLFDLHDDHHDFIPHELEHQPENAKKQNDHEELESNENIVVKSAHQWLFGWSYHSQETHNAEFRIINLLDDDLETHEFKLYHSSERNDHHFCVGRHWNWVNYHITDQLHRKEEVPKLV